VTETRRRPVRAEVRQEVMAPVAVCVNAHVRTAPAGGHNGDGETYDVQDSPGAPTD
jgi:hypothetical protein